MPHAAMAAPAGAMAAPAPPAPAGTFAPGTKVQVGHHRVIIDKYLSEGGFAHVYRVRLPQPIDGSHTAVLKRVAVPNRPLLTEMRTEVETMKRLQGQPYIVTYMDSHASQLRGEGFEVFLLMEYCDGGGLIDLMNTRLQNRLTEPEILAIFGDVALGVACMHYLKPPLLHRDLKVENVLILNEDGGRTFKLCDFGSAAPPRPAATSAAEGRQIEEDVQRHTTLQYRSPEMIDVYRKQPIDEKSDIWALGVLLYKLCYYTTPFEEQGQMAILNASFVYPHYPPFSDRLKKLIAMMLQEHPQKRPNIYQVVSEVCSMRHMKVPIKDIYANRTTSQAQREHHSPSPSPHPQSSPKVGAFNAPAVRKVQKIPEITPMRRGRPGNLQARSANSQPSPSPGRPVSSDPFAALDQSPRLAAGSGSGVPSASAADSGAGTSVGSNTIPSFEDASERFPSLESFSLLHESGSTFAFGSKPGTPTDAGTRPPVASTKPFIKPSERPPNSETEALADEVFASVAPTRRTESSPVKPVRGTSHLARASQSTEASDGMALPNRVSTALASKTATARDNMLAKKPSDEPDLTRARLDKDLPPRPIHRFPSHGRSSSQTRSAERNSTSSLDDSLRLPPRPSMLEHRSRSQLSLFSHHATPASSRPSLELNRSSELEADDKLTRSASTNTKGSRPRSSHFEHATKMFRNRSPSHSKNAPSASSGEHPAATENEDGNELGKIDSNVEFLKAMEDDESLSKRREKRSSGSGSTKGSKRTSLPSISLTGTKTLLSGRFGGAFRRFETNSSTQPDDPEREDSLDDARLMTPIAGSVATSGERSDDDDAFTDHESSEVPPEMRRELERRRLSQEERRVAEAAAAYKRQLATTGSSGIATGVGGLSNGNFSSSAANSGDVPERNSSIGGLGPGRLRHGSRAALIQNKVQALLDESNKPSPTRTAAGYGRYTESPELESAGRGVEASSASKSPTAATFAASRSPGLSVSPSKYSGLSTSPSKHSGLSTSPSKHPNSAFTASNTLASSVPTSTVRPSQPSRAVSPLPMASRLSPNANDSAAVFDQSSSARSTAFQRRSHVAPTSDRPAAPPKPQALRTGGHSASSSIAQSHGSATGIVGQNFGAAPGIIGQNLASAPGSVVHPPRMSSARPQTNAPPASGVSPSAILNSPPHLSSTMSPPALAPGSLPPASLRGSLHSASAPPGAASLQSPEPASEVDLVDPEAWEANFARKYPSLGGLEMVETAIDK